MAKSGEDEIDFDRLVDYKSKKSVAASAFVSLSEVAVHCAGC